MRHGIPAYRLARPVLDAEIERILAMGVEARLGSALDSAESLAELRAKFDIVYLAMGARQQKRLPQLDYSRAWVMDGAVYLAASNAGAPPQLGRKLIVIGGGSAAIDAARSARRAGHDVTLMSLETADQMPAQHEEVAEALEEGIELCAGAMITAAAEDGDAVSFSCVRVDFRPGAVRGEFTVEPVAGSEFTLRADGVIPSIGQDPDLAPLTDQIDADGRLVKVDATQATSAEGVYAGGDVASMARFVTEAIGMGKRAAKEIDRVLRAADPETVRETAAAAGSGQVAAELAEAGEAVVGLKQISTFYYPQQERAAEQRLGVEERLRSDAEVQIGFDLEQALAETERCFSCGTCVYCDNCFYYCPDLAIRRLPERGGYEVLTDFCKGCGVCVGECPTGSMKMVEDAR
ncbi:MAG: FAD-dependent oxidoreductase [Burkholderiaceae bacterium]|nr:FAD-dependent oxidoreductase [Burkholderiaceae bacterium]